MLDSLARMLLDLWGGIEPHRRRQFVGLLLLMILGSLAEVVSIGAVVPFLGVFVNPDKAFNYPLIHPLLVFFGITTPSQAILPLTIVFCFISLVAGGIRIIQLRLSLGYAFGLGADLGVDLYRKTLYQPYSVHINRNSSEVINGIAIKTSEVIFYIIVPAMTLISATLITIAVLLVLYTIVPAAALGCLFFFGLAYAVMIKLLRKKLKINSSIITVNSTRVLQHLQEGLGGIRDTLINGTQEYFVENFSYTDKFLRSAQLENGFFGQAPRFLMESVGMMLIAFIAYGSSKGSIGMENVIPMLAVLALGLQRLLPSLQQIYSSIASIHGYEESLRDMLKLLSQPLKIEANKKSRDHIIKFEKYIQIRSLGFRYSTNADWIFKDINFVIPKGSRIGFVGETGSGKSTLLDIVMGLLFPTCGELLVDDIGITSENVSSWRSHIAHVPQDIFLVDGSICENIAFGVPRNKIDMMAVVRAAELSQIAETINGWRDGFNTLVGERGIQLSGGQRQRIGIARALYKKADVLVFDEATSALDASTEEAVMRAIDSMDEQITILIIAHRTTTLKNCEKIIQL